MRFLHFENVLKPYIEKFGMIRLNERKMALRRKESCKKSFGSPRNIIFVFFGNCVPYNKDDL
jgi:hypothetical protein